MRDIALTTIFFSILPFVFSRPYIGIYLWTWLSLMNPHRLTYGFAYDFPFAEITAIVTLVALAASKEKKQIPWTRETILLLIFALWMFFTTFFALYPDSAWEQWGKVWKIIFMIYITLILIDTKNKLQWLVWIAVVSLGFYGVKGGIFTILHGGAYRVQGPTGSFISGNNELALALIMVIPLMRYLQLQTRNFWAGQALTLAMLLTGIAAIGSQSRGALVGMIMMGSFLALKSRRKIATLISILVVIVALGAIMPQSWYDRMSTIRHYEHDESAEERLHAWSTAFKLASDRITGGGFETFKPGLYYRYGDAPEHLRGTDAHSIYFEVLGEHGFIGLGLFLLLAWFTWNTASRIRRQAGQSAETVWCADLANMIQVSLVGYASAGAFLGLGYFDLYYDLIAMMVICSMLLKQQLLNMQAEVDTTQPGVRGRARLPDSELRSLSRKH